MTSREKLLNSQSAMRTMTNAEHVEAHVIQKKNKAQSREV